eukprot:augustus_masked-scaffold_19-processed-gene-5.45-mRNA-1 protein AED:1.00 eAED:1.00 QI:0/0/0/0/1/1/2/0/1086
MEKSTGKSKPVTVNTTKTGKPKSTLAKLSLEVEDSTLNFSSASISPGGRGFNSSSLHSGAAQGSTAALRRFKHAKPFYPRYTKRTNIEMSNLGCEAEFAAQDALGNILKAYILKKCSINPYCRKTDFDGTALEGLNRLFFIQSLQAIEHYSMSVSERIQKKPAYLMGILRGQESHWDNSRAAAHLDGGSMQLLNLPGRVLKVIGEFCLEGNCLPSDFTPEVLLSLHSLTVELGIKAIQAFNSNKRIVAGQRGGVVNRPRFLQRLIENVIQQNPLDFKSIETEYEAVASMDKRKENIDDKDSVKSNKSARSFCSLLGSNSNEQSQVVPLERYEKAVAETSFLRKQNLDLQMQLQEKNTECTRLRAALERVIEKYRVKCKEVENLAIADSQLDDILTLLQHEPDGSDEKQYLLASLLQQRYPRMKISELLPFTNYLGVVLLDSGDVVYRQGEQADAGYYIIRGEINLSSNGQLVRSLNAGDVFGVTDSFVGDSVSILNKHKYTVSAEASLGLQNVKGAALLKLRGCHFHKIIDEQPRGSSATVDKDFKYLKIIADVVEPVLRSTNTRFLLSLPLFSSFQKDLYCSLSSKAQIKRATIAAEAFAIIKQILKFETLLPGTMLTQENTLTSCCYLLLSGKAVATFDVNGFPAVVAIFSRKKYTFSGHKSGDQEHIHHIGEYSLLTGHLSTFTTVVTEAAVCFSIKKVQFRALLHLIPEQNNFLYRRLKILDYSHQIMVDNPLFKSQSGAEVLLASVLYEATSYKPGEVIIRQGSRRKKEKFFLIYEGQCEVFVKDVNDDSLTNTLRTQDVYSAKMRSEYVDFADLRRQKSKKNVFSLFGRKVSTLGRGDYFGEISLLSDIDYSATIVASKSGDGVKCLTLDKRLFRELFSHNESLLSAFYCKCFGMNTNTKYFVLQDDLRLLIMKHCEKEYNLENILFYLSAVDLELLEGKLQGSYVHSTVRLTKNERQVVLRTCGLDEAELIQATNLIVYDMCKEIMEKFVLPGSEHEINISFRVRDTITTSWEKKEFNINMFNEAKAEVYGLIDSDIMSRVKCSSEFVAALAKLKVYDFGSLNMKNVNLSLLGKKRKKP